MISHQADKLQKSVTDVGDKKESGGGRLENKI